MYASSELEMLIRLIERAALLLITLFFMARVPKFKEILQRDHHSPVELSLLTGIFCVFALFGTYSGIEVEGSIINIRTIAIVSGGILFGPWVGIVTGIVSGVHRYLIDIGGVTSVPCLITSILAGFTAGYIHVYMKKSRRWIYGIIAGMFCETLTMILILAMADSFELGVAIVSKIGIPMILGQVSIGLIILMIASVEGEKERIAAQQSQLALNIANKTLPYFRSINGESLRTICRIIKDDIKADAVAITDTKDVLAYVGYGEEKYKIGQEIISDLTKETIRNGQIKEEANKAEIRALQSKINPHFLFNALNAIASTTRRDPEKARELIISLSGYMRYNLEVGEELIEVQTALEQVRNYIKIEKARFGERLQVVYDIDDLHLKLPSLLIQPLVENAVVHGILKQKGPGSVTISIKEFQDKIRVSVRDTGKGIDQEVIDRLHKGEVSSKQIGLFNVHQRVKLIYGTDLVIHRLNPGTEVYFDIGKEPS